MLDDGAGEVVLVGHSYGGMVITEAALGRDDVAHLVYLCAFCPDAGESINDLYPRGEPVCASQMDWCATTTAPSPSIPASPRRPSTPIAVKTRRPPRWRGFAPSTAAV
ncbi:MAG: alpha/beta fold hydrolase [Gammaproteobacteria bacterium]|nr:alpha/beta fold hydrolase [Gammaproteobacteria bacterium]